MYTKKSLRPLVLKTDVTLVKTLRLIILDFFTGNSFSSDRRMFKTKFYYRNLRRKWYLGPT